MRIIIACVLLLMLGGCHNLPLPDEGVSMETDKRGEIVIQAWEDHLERAAKECRFTMSGISCPW